MEHHSLDLLIRVLNYLTIVPLLDLIPHCNLLILLQGLIKSLLPRFDINPTLTHHYLQLLIFLNLHTKLVILRHFLDVHLIFQLARLIGHSPKHQIGLLSRFQELF